MATSAVASPAVTATLNDANPACTANHLTMIAALQDEVWLNEPHPASSVTYTTCYASEVVSSLIAAETVSVPAFRELLGGCAGAAAGYEIVVNGTDGYIACCPSGYTLDAQTYAPSTRTALNGTCYSNMPTTTTTVTAIQTDGITSVQAYFDPAGTAQAFAHVIDGYIDQAPLETGSSSVSTSSTVSSIAMSTDSSTVPTTASFTTSVTASSALAGSATAITITTPTSTSSSSSSSLSGGDIGGLVAGVVIGIFLLLLGAFLFLRRRNRNRRTRHRMGDSNNYSNRGSYGNLGGVAQRDASPASELDAFTTDKYSDGPRAEHLLSGMDKDRGRVTELPAPQARPSGSRFEME